MKNIQSIIDKNVVVIFNSQQDLEDFFFYLEEDLDFTWDSGEYLLDIFNTYELKNWEGFLLKDKKVYSIDTLTNKNYQIISYKELLKGKEVDILWEYK